MSFKQEFAKRLKYWREKRGMTTEELRDLAGLTGRAKATLSKSLNGVRNYQHHYSIS